MEDIVYEIIGGAVILGIIMIVISVFRTGTGVIRGSADKQFELDSVSIVDMIGYDGGKYDGSKVKDALEYASMNSGIEVKFDYDTINYIYTSAGLEGNGNACSKIELEELKGKLVIAREKKYTLKIDYIASDGSTRMNKGDAGIAKIIFNFN